MAQGKDFGSVHRESVGEASDRWLTAAGVVSFAALLLLVAGSMIWSGGWFVMISPGPVGPAAMLAAPPVPNDPTGDLAEMRIRDDGWLDAGRWGHAGRDAFHPPFRQGSGPAGEIGEGSSRPPPHGTSAPPVKPELSYERVVPR